ncbi:MAG: hypothetical protein Q7U78_05925 [Gallionella sp.]|nr:hypothetical protein [Gallionella sp.]
MENVPKKIGISEAGAAAAMPLLNLAIADDVQGVGLENIISGCKFFILSGVPGSKFAYAVKAAGSELWVQAAGGSGAVDLSAFGLAVIEQQAAAAGLGSVGFQTRRRGLVRKAARAGYQVDGYIMRKIINA